MDFPIVDLFDDDLSAMWLLKYFHQNQLKYPHCGKSVEEAHVFHMTKKSQLTVYRCPCQDIYNLLLRGVCKGEPTAAITCKIGVARQTVHDMRRAIQTNAERRQPQDPVPDQRTETDEIFQNAGEKGGASH